MQLLASLKLIGIVALAACIFPMPEFRDEAICFQFKGQKITLRHKIGANNFGFTPRSPLRQTEFDTSCNVFFASENRVEIIRQDDRLRPKYGLALRFEFDEENGEYPFTPAEAVFQLKDFGYGGVEFDLRDTCNYTGVSNEVSEDVAIEILDFRGDTIFGRFAGLLLSGGGGKKMAPIEDGTFKIRLFRKE